MDKVSQLLAGAFELFYRESVHGWASIKFWPRPA